MSLADRMAGFLDMLDTGFRRQGVAEGLPPSLRTAVQEVLRHRFVHRFRIGEGELRDAEADPSAQLATIYSDQVLRHVAADGTALPSSNSQPSYVLWLLHLLDLRPGHRVLEIGSGSGWLAGIMAALVGPQGHVTGIEILAELAAQSRADLAALGLHHVTIRTGDGAAGDAQGAPFDRAIITAAVWDLPPALFAQVAEGGLVLAPIELRGEAGCQVSLLRRSGPRFVTERATPGWFVPLVGAGQVRAAHVALESLPVCDTPAVFCCPLPAAAQPQFRAFLGRTEPGFALFGPDAPGAAPPWTQSWQFGVLGDDRACVAVCAGGELRCHGGLSAGRALIRAYLRWAELGLPGLAAFTLDLVPAGTAPRDGSEAWVEPRGGTDLIWRLAPDATAWRRLLDPDPAATVA